ncbi:Lacal_2735 family protein [Marinoscillum sp.]|uniref:Lacal_2735 family protein n=1 Tax=Marinoscillum sp. TaxID=2024838 RepID=UPI003873A880
MNIFNIFSPRPKRELLQDRYDKLMERVYELEMSNLKAAELTRRKAQRILLQLVELEKATSQ